MTKRLVSVDALRAVAALAVLMVHAPLSANFLPEWARFWVLLPHNYGWVGLNLFIVLSGLCIHLPVARRMASGAPAQARWRAFWWRRFVRLYPPYVAAVLLSVAVYYSIGAEAYPADERITSLPHDLAAHFLMIHNLFRDYCQSLGNGALWSLGLEEQLYGLYAVYLVLRRRAKAGHVLLIGFVVSAAWMIGLRAALGIGKWGYAPSWPDGPFALGRWMQWPFAWWFPWLLGAVAAEAHAGAIRLPKWVTGWAALVVVSAVALGTSSDFLATYAPALKLKLPSGVNELVWCVAAFLVLSRAVSMESAGGFRGSVAAGLARLGVMSYSLYLVHVPVLYAVRHAFGPATDPLGVGLRFAAAIGISLTVAVAFFFSIERWFISRGRLQHLETKPAASGPG